MVAFTVGGKDADGRRSGPDLRDGVEKWRETSRMKDVEYQELNWWWQADAQQTSPTVNGRERALTLMFPASLSRLRVMIYLPRPFDKIGSSCPCPAGPPLTAYIRVTNIFTRLKWK